MSTSATTATKPSGLLGSYALCCRLADYFQSPLLLLIRLYWGWQFMQTGWGKLHNLSHVRDFFSSLGIPAPGFTAPAIASLEFFGGILLIIGLGSRFIGLLMACNMFVAYVTSDREALFSILKDPSKFYVADPFTFLFASLIIVVFGAGLFSLDALIARRGIRSA